MTRFAYWTLITGIETLMALLGKSLLYERKKGVELTVFVDFLITITESELYPWTIGNKNDETRKSFQSHWRKCSEHSNASVLKMMTWTVGTRTRAPFTDPMNRRTTCYSGGREMGIRTSFCEKRDSFDVESSKSLVSLICDQWVLRRSSMSCRRHWRNIWIDLERYSWIWCLSLLKFEVYTYRGKGFHAWLLRILLLVKLILRMIMWDMHLSLFCLHSLTRDC
jgi:hypothetical protein